MKLKYIVLAGFLTLFAGVTHAQQSQSLSPTVVQLTGLSENLTSTTQPNLITTEAALKKAKSYISRDIESMPTTDKELIRKKQNVLNELNQLDAAKATNAVIASKIEAYIQLCN